MDFSQRSHEKEIMDDYAASDIELTRFYDDLSWINRYLFGKRIFTTGIKDLYKDLSSTSLPITLADFACGGGSTLNACALWSNNKKLPISFLVMILILFYLNMLMINQPMNYPLFLKSKIYFPVNFQKKTFDIIMCNLFCHHLTDEQIIYFFKQMHHQAQKGIIINDLQRHWLAYVGFNVFSFLKKLLPITKHDGLVSIKKGFTKQEIIYLLQKSEIKHYKITWRFPFYYNIIIYKE